MLSKAKYTMPQTKVKYPQFEESTTGIKLKYQQIAQLPTGINLKMLTRLEMQA